MTEQDFLDSYDPKAFPPVGVTVDLVAVAVIERCLSVLVIRRGLPPYKDWYALPGMILQPDEDLNGCAGRAARDKAGLERVSLRQFEAFSAPDRDPRMRMVSVGFLALTTADVLLAATAGRELEREIGKIGLGDEVPVLNASDEPEQLAFDHNRIVAAAVRRLQADLDRTTDAFGLLPDVFTLRELQIVHEAVRGETVNKPAFRKRMLDSGRLEPLGRKDVGGPFRPAELYRLRDGAA